jgi:predicted DNA-binding transcriptional regulator AlpA
MEQITWPDGRRFVRTDELARLSGLSESFWCKLRLTKRGPKYTKAGAAVLYSVDELDRWFASNTVASTSERAAA